jgi:hypothetical protein
MSNIPSNSENSNNLLEGSFWKIVDVLHRYLSPKEYYLALYIIMVYRNSWDFKVLNLTEKVANFDIDFFSTDAKDVNEEFLQIHQVFRSKMKSLSSIAKK